MKLLLVLLLGIIHQNYARTTYGQSFAGASANYRNFDSSFAFKLYLENYSNKYLSEPHYLDHNGYVYDAPQPIGPGMAEMMTGHKASFTVTGVAGVVSWNIGSTNKMVVVMYDLPWSHIFYTNTLAIGIFPKGDLTGFYNKMYNGEEQGFKRHTYPGPGGWSSPIRYRDDPDFMVEGNMGDAHKSGINIQFYPKTASGLASPEDDQLIAALLDI